MEEKFDVTGMTCADQEKLQEFGINPSSIPEEVYYRRHRQNVL